MVSIGWRMVLPTEEPTRPAHAEASVWMFLLRWASARSALGAAVLASVAPDMMTFFSSITELILFVCFKLKRFL